MIYEGVEGLYKLHHEYYKTAELHIDSLPRREIAFNSFSKGFHSWDRHNTFNTTDEIKEFIQKRNPPAGLFASTGHFLDPQIKYMTLRGAKDNWKGNDFILDLDKKMKPEQTRYDFIDKMSNLTLQLIDDFLIPLGFEEKNIQIDFSGNKGFHLMVNTPEYIEMSKENRTHILDYLTANRLDKSTIFRSNNTKLVRLSNYGWSRQGVRLLDHLLVKNNYRKLVERDLWMFPKKYHRQVVKMLSNQQTIDDLSRGKLIIDNKLTDILADGVVKYHKKHLGSIIDRKPTIDKNRILRIPGSIHGVSGLASVPLTREHLELPDLIFDKLMQTIGEDEVKINLQKDITVNFPNHIEYTAGPLWLPRYEAILALTQENLDLWT